MPDPAQPDPLQPQPDPLQPQPGQPQQRLIDLIQGGTPTFTDGGTGQSYSVFSPDSPATPEAINWATAMGGRPKPQLASAGPEGGWFGNIPISGQGAETFGPGLGYFGGMVGGGGRAPPMGLQGPSTNNWRLLPTAYQSPSFRMYAGHIIDNYWNDKPLGYVNYHGGAATEGTANLGGPGHGFPTSFGSPSSRGYFFPGQIEPWITEGGTGTY